MTPKTTNYIMYTYTYNIYDYKCMRTAHLSYLKLYAGTYHKNHPANRSHGKLCGTTEQQGGPRSQVHSSSLSSKTNGSF